VVATGAAAAGAAAEGAAPEPEPQADANSEKSSAPVRLRARALVRRFTKREVEGDIGRSPLGLMTGSERTDFEKIVVGRGGSRSREGPPGPVT
jgi:hypothetical protein